MSTEDSFFCFPLGLLAYRPKEPEWALSNIIDYSVGLVARTTYGNWDLKTLMEHAEDRGAYTHSKTKPHSPAQFRLLLAADTIGVAYPGLKSIPEQIGKAESFLSTLSPSARNNTVRIKAKWLWDCKATVEGSSVERSLSWREFRILCAVLSKVGAKGVKKCGWREIQARAAGFCGKQDMAQCLSVNARSSIIHTRSQIRVTLDRLETDWFFARFNYGRKGSAARESWFSFSMSNEELRAAVLGRKNRRDEKLATLRSQDQQAIAKSKPTYRQPVANINTKTPEKPLSVANINKAKKSDQPVANVVANAVANVVANINENNINENNSYKKQRVKNTAGLKFEFRREDSLRWAAFLKTKGLPELPIEGCASAHAEFNEWLKNSRNEA